MVSPDPAVVERQYYLDKLGIPDDPSLSLADLLSMTGGGARVESARRVGMVTPEVITAAPTRLSAFTMLKAALEDANAQRSIGIQVLGDSTGNDTTDWPYLLAQDLALKYPSYTVKHRLWDDATQQYLAPTTLQLGPLGERCLDTSTGTTTRRLDASVSTHLTGVIDVRMKVSMADWTPGTAVSMGGRSTADPVRSWYVGINSIGLMTFTWTPTGLGANLVTKSSTVALAFVDGTTNWLRWVFTPDNGAAGYDVEFFYGADGVTWTKLGATVTTAGVATIYNNNIGYEVGGVASGVGGAGVGGLKVYEIYICDGRDGPSIVPALPDLWPPYSAAAAVFTGSRVITIVNGSRAGANIAYLGDATRIKKLTPDFGQVVNILSNSHNEGLLVGKAWALTYDAWITSIQNRLFGVPNLILTQNPETNGTTWWKEHSRRRYEIMAYAKQKGIDYIDTYDDFLRYPNYSVDLLADPVHPNLAGSTVWKNSILSAFNAS